MESAQETFPNVTWNGLCILSVLRSNGPTRPNEIVRRVYQISNQATILPLASVYFILNQLQLKGLATRVGGVSDEPKHGKRRRKAFFQITELGEKVLKFKAESMIQLANQLLK